MAKGRIGTFKRKGVPINSTPKGVKTPSATLSQGQPAPAIAASGEKNPYTNPDYTPEQQATDTMALQYGPQESAYNRQLSQTNNDYAHQQAVQKEYAGSYDTKLQDIYNQLHGQLGAQQPATQASYAGTGQQVGQSYDDASQRLSQIVSGGQQDTKNLANQLGMGNAAGDANQRMQNLLSQYQALNTTNKASSLASLQGQGQNEQSYQQNQEANAGMQGAQARKDVTTQLQNTLGQLGRDQTLSTNDIKGKLADLAASKGPAYSNMLQQIRSGRYEANRQAMLDDFAQQIQAGTLQLQQQRVGLMGKGQDQNYSLGLARLQIEQQKQDLEAAKVKTNNPLEQAKIQSQIDKMDAETSRLNQTPISGIDPYTRLDQFLNNFPYTDNGQAGPRFRAAINDAIGSSTDLASAIRNSAGNAQKYGLNTDALARALSVYYGK